MNKLRFYLCISRNIRTFISVKQQVIDINGALRRPGDKIESMQKFIDSQHTEICALNRTVERLLSLFSTMFNVSISQGTLANIVVDMMKESEPAIELIEHLLKEYQVVGFDESGCYTNGKLNWSWIARTSYLTLVFRGTKRESKVLEDRFGESLKNMVAVTNRPSTCFAIDFLDNQVCLAHLLCNLEYQNDIDKSQTWTKEAQDLLGEAIHERYQRPAEVIPTKSWLSPLDELLKQNLDHLRKEFNELKRGLIKCRDYIFNFLENPAIPPDNNASERRIRKLKVKNIRVLSFGSRGRNLSRTTFHH